MPAAPATPSPIAPAEAIGDFRRIRARSVVLAAPLSAEDAAVQSMPDASPAKWHLAHTSWFFEQFLLGAEAGYRPWRAGWAELFNSYYVAVGSRYQRASRGMLTRPSLAEVLDYREVIDQRVAARLQRDDAAAICAIVALGLQHEQQHQELLLTDIKHLLSLNPLQPAYRDDLAQRAAATAVPLHYLNGAEGVVSIGGHHGDGFAYDCETPRHAVLLGPHAIANRPVNNSEYREFIHDGGYRNPSLWLSEGWATVQAEGWHAPLYWNAAHDGEFTLGGPRSLDPLAPVCHLSYYEADAFARWAGMRLPTEAEWEAMAAEQSPPSTVSAAGEWIENDALHPQPPPAGDGLLQMFGEVWQWTASPYVPYPRFKPLPGALGEYNGKFMCGQWVLRGGSCATPAGHIRASYRNFFYPRDRWQFMGLRLAMDR